MGNETPRKKTTKEMEIRKSDLVDLLLDRSLLHEPVLLLLLVDRIGLGLERALLALEPALLQVGLLARGGEPAPRHLLSLDQLELHGALADGR